MKKTIYAAFVFAALGLTSCGGGETSDAEMSENKTEESNENTEKEMPTTYKLVGDESKLGWKGTWIAPTGEDGAMEEQKNHTGTVQFTEGSLTKDGDNVTGGFTIDMTTIENTDLTEADGKPKLEGHLASEDFFNVEQFSKAKVMLNGMKDGMADITIDVMGMTMNETIPMSLTEENGAMMLTGEFDVDFSALEFGMFSPNPEKPEEGNIDPNLSFNVKAKLAE